MLINLALWCLLEYMVYSKGEPYFRKFPEDISAVQGTSITLPCEVSPSKGFRYYWELNGLKIPNTTRRYQVGSNLHITRLDREQDTGQFTCIAKDVTGRSAAITSSPASVNIQWIGQPSVKLQEPTVASEIVQGTDVVLRCHVDATDNVHIEWFRNSHVLTKSHKLILKKNKLHIKNVQVADNGVYRCTTQNTAGLKESIENFPLIVKGNNNVLIKIVPSDVIIKKNDTAMFNCVYDGIEKVEWYFQKIPLENNNRIRIHSNGSLEINNISEKDEGLYTCVGSNQESQSYTAKLSLAYIDPLTAASFEPPVLQNFQVVTGLGFVFQLTCLKPKSMPTAKSWWEDSSGHTVSDRGRIRVDEDRMLIIENVKMEDSGRYKCVATNIAGTVEKVIEIVVTEKPSVTKDPSSTAVDQGTTAQLSCEFATNFPVHTVVKWQKDGKEIKSESSDQRVRVYPQNGTLIIYNTQTFDRGEYICEVLTTGHKGVLSKPASLSVIEQLKFSPPPVNKNIELGSVARIHCKAQGTPPPIVNWQKGGSSEKFPTHVADINGTLQFNGVLPDDRGTYTCIASNSQGIINASINVEVVVAPKFAIEPKNPTEVEEGKSISIDCVAEGDPKPKIHWDKNLKMNDFDASRFQILTNGTLFITEVHKDDENTYGCTAGSSAGLNRKEVKLIVYPIDKNYSGVDDGNTVTKAVTITMTVASAYIILVVGLTVWCRYKRRPRNSNFEGSKHDDGNIDHVELKDSGNCSSIAKTNGQVVDEPDATNYQSDLYDKPTLSRTHLKDLKLIGRGEYGDVMVAKVMKHVLAKNSKTIQINSTSGEDKEVPVLVKALSQAKDENCMKEFKREIDMFSSALHDNVTKLYGLCTESEPHYLILEHTDWGDLKKFLVATKDENVLSLTIVQSITILHQLSRGMEHLASNKWVHKDLAARNCLMSSTLFAKISLPKLTKDPYSQEYCKHIDQVLPVRWLPHEAVYEENYSTKTDVYSFAVLIWEIFSQGELPHSKMSDTNFLMRLKQNTLEWKAHSSTPERLVKMQESCWNNNPDERPSFDTLSAELSSILTSF